MDWLLTPEGIGCALSLALLAGYASLFFKLRIAEDTHIVAHIRVLAWVYLHVAHRMQLEGETEDSVPAQGPAVLVANHRSGLDPVALGVAARRRVHFLMAREYYETPILRWFYDRLGCIPVNRDGNDLGAMKAALQLLRQGKVVGIFPQGGIREPGSELEGKAGVVMLAIKTDAPIVPFYLDGTPSCDSVLRAYLTPSRTTIWRGAAYRLDNAGRRKLTRAQQDLLTRQVLNSIATLAPSGPTNHPTEVPMS